MDVEKLKAASGGDLDAAGVEMKLDRATIARGHSFDEADDSYRRRLVAQLAGAAAADALVQPAEVALSAEEEAGPVVVLEGGTVIRGKAAAEILRLQREVSDRAPPISTEPKKPGAQQPELKQDGPTVEEWVLAGYAARAYPPHGYASRSSAEEIQAAIAAQEAAKHHIPADEQGGKPDDDPEPEQGAAGQPTKPLP